MTSSLYTLIGNLMVLTLHLSIVVNPVHAECEWFGSLSTLIPSSMSSDGLPSCCVIEKELMFVEKDNEFDHDISDLTSPDGRGLNDLIVSFGQFSLSHDNALTGEDAENSITESCGASFEFVVNHNKISRGGEEENKVTACTDASNVYGSGEFGRLDALADLETGLLRTDANLLPPKGLCPMANPKKRAPQSLFSMGDERGNENTFLVTHHIIWVREHNYWAKRLKKKHPDMCGTEISHHARRMVVAEMQKVVAYDFIDALLGETNSLDSFEEVCGAEPATGHVHIFKEFSQSIWRVPHAMINNDVVLQTHTGHTEKRSLDSVFFEPEVATSHGLEKVVAGMVSTPAKRLDLIYPSDLIISKSPLSPNIHLGAKDCLRGRGSSMATYSEARDFYNLGQIRDWSDITQDLSKQQKLESVYRAGNWKKVDLLVGALAEDHLEESSVGPVLASILKTQMYEIRCQDKEWFERPGILSKAELDEVQRTTYSDIILRNTDPTLLPRLPENVFKVPSIVNQFKERTHYSKSK